MGKMLSFSLSSLSLWLLAASSVACQQTGKHTSWPRWCGKVYEPGLYLDGEGTGEFVVNAGLSKYHGKPLPPFEFPGEPVDVKITFTSTGEVLAQDFMQLGSMGNLLSFDLSRLKPSLEPYQLELTARTVLCDTAFTATSELYYLPEKKAGSVTKLDNLNGGMLFRNTASKGRFEPLLAYGFYSSYDGFLGDNNTAEIQQYADYGLNAMTPLTTYPVSAAAFDYMDKINLRFMYDMRDILMNLSQIAEQVALARDAEALFAYWSADEPDGWQYAFNATVLAHQVIKREDPYHPVAVVLNCQDYYFGEYSAGADIIMEDVYPIIASATWSKWGTACNTTLGDCGCDNCAGNVRDVPNRLDDLARYEGWLGRWPKTKIHNPQSFDGEGYWPRNPYPDEEWAMGVMALNHGAQSFISWVYPDSQVLSEAHGRLAKAVTAPPVVDFLVGGDRPHLVSSEASADVDAAYWVRGRQMLVCVANAYSRAIDAPVEIPLPGAAAGRIQSTAWGNLTWELRDSKLTVPKMAALDTSIVVIDL